MLEAVPALGEVEAKRVGEASWTGLGVLGLELKLYDFLIKEKVLVMSIYCVVLSFMRLGEWQRGPARIQGLSGPGSPKRGVS